MPFAPFIAASKQSAELSIISKALLKDYQPTLHSISTLSKYINIKPQDFP